ncbi:MAG TPA: hypothetical protein VD846_08540 [Allosphingosinicella sp.]|nr:hypothetical protein [Allosphingosinicella sp.]
MTGAPPVQDRPALRAALADLRIDPPEDHTSFEAALAARQGWNLRFAQRIAGEYRRFLYLAAVAGVEVTPSQLVDEAWHLHLTLPHYREILCGRILGRPLEHRPGTGTPDDDARCDRQYRQTLALYERLFGEPAPFDIWPRLTAEEEEEQEKWTLRRRSRRRRQAVEGAVAVAGAVATIWTPTLIDFFIVVFVAGVLLSMLLPGPGLSGRAGGCGGGYASDTDGGSGCGASCGGGCGGGCGGD